MIGFELLKPLPVEIPYVVETLDNSRLHATQ